jgi:hypothetical protein
MHQGVTGMRAQFANPDGTDIWLIPEDGPWQALKPGDALLNGLEIEPFPAAPRTCTPREFRARFTPEEKGALTLAASKGLENDDPALQVFLDELSASQVVELDHPELAAGMDLLVSRQLLTRERADAILAA